ncbi:MAG TPA: DUF2102 domain-containing protein [Methanocella sp.]|jgi:hypothetical protein
MAFIDPEAGARASVIIALAYRNHLPIRIKETCFGLMIEGERELIRGFVAILHDTFPSGMYLKRRPFSIGDTRICARTFDTLGLRRAVEQCRFHNNS